jgi:hypothetical protein
VSENITWRAKGSPEISTDLVFKIIYYKLFIDIVVTVEAMVRTAFITVLSIYKYNNL